jgi:hypothetical protein
MLFLARWARKLSWKETAYPERLRKKIGVGVIRIKG